MKKICTDIEQSKKLAEILPIKSADMWWSKNFIYYNPTAAIGISAEYSNAYTYKFGEDDIPCWSLAALIDILPHRIDDSYELVMGKLSDIGGWEVMYMYYDVDDYVEPHTKYRVIHSNSIDACFEMIVKLHEEKLL